MESKGNHSLNDTVMMHLFKEGEALGQNFQFLPGVFSVLGKIPCTQNGYKCTKVAPSHWNRKLWDNRRSAGMMAHIRLFKDFKDLFCVILNNSVER